MKKLLKKFSLIVVFIFSFAFLSSSVVFSENAVQPDVQPVAAEQATEQTKVVEETPDTIPEKNYENMVKIIDTATDSKTFAILIFAASLGLLALILFGGYKIYKKHKEQGYIVSAPPKETLESPKDFKTAINLFLGKTDE